MWKYCLAGLMLLNMAFVWKTQYLNDQTKVMPLPDALERPDTKLLDEERLLKALQKINSNSKTPWVVFTDNDQTVTYQQPLGGGTFRKLNFRDFFYVTDMKKGWIQIGKATLKKGRDIEKGSYQNYGWVRLGDVLLWPGGLRDEVTGIHKKAFLLNKVGDIEAIIKEGSRKELVKIYNGPARETTIGEKTIYEFYFILKVVNNRYLLAKDAALNPDNPRQATESIVGWVRQNRVAEWNTRIALEPNFEEAAFLERKNNRHLQVAAYSSEESAKTHSLDGVAQRSGLYWANDPVIIPPNQLAQSNPRRYKGGVVRFPMLYNAGQYYRTGVIGDIMVRGAGNIQDKIGEINYSGMLGLLQQNETGRDNYNILFVVEATLEMKACRQALKEAMQGIRNKLPDVKNLNFGVAAYRDTPEEKEKKLFEIQPLRPGTDAAAMFLEQLEFARWHDNDDYTAMYYGLYQGILGAQFRKGDTNIVILIGNHGDYSADALRKSQADKGKSKTRVEPEALVDKICELDIHLIGLQYQNNGKLSCNRFISQLRYLILNNANCQYSRVAGLPKLVPEVKLANPEIKGEEQTKDQVLTGGATVGNLSRPVKGTAFTANEIEKQLASLCKNVQTQTEDLWKMVSQIVDMGSPIGDVSMGAFTPAAMASVLQMLANSKSGAFTEADLRNLVKNKYKLYAEVYVPRVINGARHDAFSYVLFMPENDLRDYIKTLRNLANASNASPDQQRDLLYTALVELLRQFTGDSALEAADAQHISMDELRSRMEGLGKEGLSPGAGISDFFIGDLKNKRKISDAKVRVLADRILHNFEVLQSIYKQGRNYEFSYHTGNGLYFWIPVAYTL